jgi:hypothetical protein
MKLPLRILYFFVFAMRIASSTASDGSGCVTNVPAYITNVVCAFDITRGWTVTFDIQGGTRGLFYDVFTATTLAGNRLANSSWTWLERCPTCSTVQHTHPPATCAFYALGTPQDLDRDGLTDAFEHLVSRTDSNQADTDGDGLWDGWEYAHQLDPLAEDSEQPAARLNYLYDAAGRLRAVYGARSERIGIDAEGNLTQVSP